jgi:hypothetical protein
MQIAVVIEPVTGNGYRARGDLLGLSAPRDRPGRLLWKVSATSSRIGFVTERKSSRWKLPRRTLGWSSPECSKATPCLTTCNGLWPRIANGTRPILTTHERAS